MYLSKTDKVSTSYKMVYRISPAAALNKTFHLSQCNFFLRVVVRVGYKS